MGLFKKCILPIVIFTLPFLLVFNFIAFSMNENGKTVDLNFFKYYLSLYPKDDIEELNIRIGELRNIGFKDDDLFQRLPEADWSGNIFQDIQELGTMISTFFSWFVDFFKAILSYHVWFFKTLYYVGILLFDNVSWVFSLPNEIRFYIS